MKRALLPAAFLGIAAAATPAAAYPLCFHSNTYDSTYYVYIGDSTFQFAGSTNVPCQEVSARGVVKGGNSPTLKLDCAFTVPAEMSRGLFVAITRINPGIGGIQPVMNCAAMEQ